MTNKIIFFVILALAFILRFYKLGEVPLSLDWDENSNAYNAYSILKTGRDEYGQLLPITNRSFEDYKPPFYMYSNIPSVAVFGLTAFAARLPSAILGFATVPIIYFLTKFLLKDQNQKKQEYTALASMAFLAISPWHIQFSRVGFESISGLFFATASITAFLYGLKNKWLLFISGILLGLSSYTYHTERIFVPILFAAAFILFKKDLVKISKKYLVAFIFSAIIIGLPLVILIPPKVIFQRFETTTGRPRIEDIEKSIKFIQEDQENFSLGKILHNRRLTIGQTFFGNYLSHFDFNFLFIEGDDNFRHHIQDMGMLYLFELPLLVYGLFILLKKHDNHSVFILAWLLISPIAAMPATPNPHANRALPMVISLEIISAYAFVSIFYIRKITNVIKIFSLCVIFLSLVVYLHNYWNHYPYEKASFWQYGYKEAVLESQNLKKRFSKIYVGRSLEQSYIFWLFNLKYDPSLYQKYGSRDHFDNFYFDAKPPASRDELYISSAGTFPSGFNILKTINYPDGSEAIKIGYPQ